MAEGICQYAPYYATTKALTDVGRDTSGPVILNVLDAVTSRSAHGIATRNKGHTQGQDSKRSY